MAQTRTHLSPLLVGRDEVLRLAERRLEEVVASRGHFMLISGEAGIGKTRLITAIRHLAEAKGFQFAAAELAPQDQDVPAASFLDLARAMIRARPFMETGRGILALAEQALAAERSTRRLLVARIVDGVGEAASNPTMLWFEDLQWADELSLEILSDLARRTRDQPLLLIGSYRTEDVGPRAILRDWRSQLITRRVAEEVRLPRLTLEQTALVTTLIAGSGLPAPSDVVNAVFERTDGVPLHIEELLGALAGDALVDGRAIREAAVPESLEDATLQRIGRLSVEAQRVAGAGAVIGRRFVPEVLARIMDVPVETLDAPLQELVDHSVLHPPGAREEYDYRHQLLRDALYKSVSTRDRRRFHARAAQFGAQLEGASEIHASVHFERAGLRPEAFRTALSGARAAARIGAHREAVGLYERVLRNLPDDLDPGDHARVLEESGIEAAAIDDNATAESLLIAARAQYLDAGRSLAAAEIVAPLTAIRHLLGQGFSGAEPGLNEALREVEALPESREQRRVRARLTAALASAYALALRLDEAESAAKEALAIAREIDDEATELNALTTLGMSGPFLGRIAEGFEAGTETIRRARDAGLDEEAARAYRWLGSTASEVFEPEAAERWLREGIDHAERTELGNHRNYMTAQLGFVMWQVGRWDEATALAERALADGRGGITTRIAALFVGGFVQLGRGSYDEATDRLEESLKLAERLGELLRLSAPIWGLAEVALLQGRHGRAIELTERGRYESGRVGDAAYLIAFVVTGARARLAAGDPVGAKRWIEAVAEAIRRRPIPAGQHALDHAAGLMDLSDGAPGKALQALRAAVQGWDERQRVWEATWGRLDQASCLLRTNRPAEAAALTAKAESVGAALQSQPIIARSAELRRAIRGRGLPDEPWRPLTVREFEVARLIAQGFTNAAIAAELTVSPKTASSHVEHILAKLGVSRRTEIAVWVSLVGASERDSQPIQRR